MPPTFLQKRSVPQSSVAIGGIPVGVFNGTANEFSARAAPKYWKPIMQAVSDGAHIYLRVADWALVDYSAGKPAKGFLSTLGVLIPTDSMTPPPEAAIFDVPGGAGSSSEGGSSNTGGD